MLDMQKARLRHLMANAILELWKKETGSLTPVFIEGTVCITSRNGRTTIIQVADQLPGSLQEENGGEYFTATTDDRESRAAFSYTPSSPSSGQFTPKSNPLTSAVESSPVNGRCLSRRVVNGNATATDSFKNFTNGSEKQWKTSCGKMGRSGGESSRRSISSVQQQLQQRQLLHIHQQQQRVQLVKDDNNNQSEEVDAELATPIAPPTPIAKVKVESSSDDDDEEDDCSDRDRSLISFSSRAHASKSNNSTFSKVEEQDADDDGDEREREGDDSFEEKNDSAIQDMSVDLSTSELNSSKLHTPYSSSCPTSERTPRRLDVASQHRRGSSTGGEDESTGSTRGARGDVGRIKSGEEGREQAVVDLSRRDTDLLISSPQSYTDQVRDAIRRRLLATTSIPMLNLGLSPLSVISTSPSAVSSSQDMFKKSRESPYSRSTSLITVGDWNPPQLMKHPIGRMVQRSTSGPSPMDVRILAKPFSPPHLSLAHPTPISLLPPPCMRKSIMDSQRPAPLHASLHKMLVGGVASACQDQSGNDADDKRSLSAPSVADGDAMDGNCDAAGSDLGGSELLNAAIGGEPHVYRCDYCAKTFLFKSKYHEHLPVHTSMRPFQCHLCSRTYKYKYDLRVHLRTHLGIPTKSTVCPFCTDKFGTNKLLRQHIRDVHKEQQQIGEDQCARSLEHLASAVASGGCGRGVPSYPNNNDHGGSSQASTSAYTRGEHGLGTAGDAGQGGNDSPTIPVPGISGSGISVSGISVSGISVGASEAPLIFA